MKSDHEVILQTPWTLCASTENPRVPVVKTASVRFGDLEGICRDVTELLHSQFFLQ